MATNVRLQRQLEETLSLAGNNNCADCHSPSPRWASVNLGIFLCVKCASIHRKLGTHKSRVKSVTLDTWTREQIQTMKQIGNTVSNSIYNPNESLHPPPTSTGDAEERDSEIERYIRKKYELGAFKAGSSTKPTQIREPTSLNRYKDSHSGGISTSNGSGTSTGRIGYPSSGAWARDDQVERAKEKERERIRLENKKNPELNDVLLVNPNRGVGGSNRDLPALPTNVNGNGGLTVAQPRQRPVRSTSSTNFSTQNGGGNEVKLVDVEGSSSATLPLQINVSNPNPSQIQGWMGQSQSQPQPQQFGNNGYNQTQPFGTGYNPFLQPQLTYPQSTSPNYLQSQQQQNQQFYQTSTNGVSVPFGVSPQQPTNPFHQHQYTQQFQPGFAAPQTQFQQGFVGQQGGFGQGMQNGQGWNGAFGQSMGMR